LTLLLLACAAEPDEIVEVAEPLPEDTASMRYELGREGTAWTAEDVEQAMAGFIALGAPNPREIGEHFLSVLSRGDEECPGVNGTLGQNNLLGCTSESGYTYAGIGWTFSEESDPDSGVATWWRHGAEFEVLYPDGQRYYGAGELQIWAEREDEGWAWTSEGSGSWGDPTRPDWLGSGTSLAYLAEGRHLHDGSSELTIQGGLGYGGGAMHLDDFGFSTMDGCEALPHGTLKVRDPEGYWLTWELDGACASCGQLSSGDQDLGELCLDLSSWGRVVLEKWRPR
jgi:hypothetical protein